jgi:hypothetical protein
MKLPTLFTLKLFDVYCAINVDILVVLANLV